MIDENVLGEVYLIKLDWLMGSRSDPKRKWDWYSLEEKGGGVIGALGTHAIDILHWFFGQITEVNATISTSIKTRPDIKTGKLLEVTSEDVCLANLKIVNFNEESLPCQLSLSSVSKSGRGFSLEIYGSDGSLFLKSDNQQDYVHGFSLNYVDQSNKNRTISPNKEFLFTKTWADGRIAPVKKIHELWGESILNSTPVIPGLYEGLQSQKICEAIKNSSESGLSTNIR